MVLMCVCCVCVCVCEYVSAVVSVELVTGLQSGSPPALSFILIILSLGYLAIRYR